MTFLVKAFVILAMFGLVIGILKWLPDIPMPEIIQTSFQLIIDTSFWANRYLPIDTALQIFGSHLLIEFTLWLWINGTRIIGYAARLLS